MEAKVPYIALRLLPALMGAALSPIAYRTMRNMGATSFGSLLAGVMVIFENGLTTQSRLILLDSSLIFFTGLTVMFWTDFWTTSTPQSTFGFKWWLYLTATGVSMALATSVKWVGLFTIATIGISTLLDLWYLLGDRTNSIVSS